MATTNTLISRIQEVKTAGESYKNANILKDKKLEIENFLIIFNEVYQKFNCIQCTYLAIKDICDVQVDFESIKSSILLMKDKVNHSNYDKAVSNTLKRDLDRMNINLERSWKSYISNKTAAIDGVLDTLGNLISDMEEKQVLESKKGIFSTARAGSPAALKAIEDYEVTYNSLMDKLKLKDDVLAFIKLLTSGKPVTLKDLNDEVYE